MMRASSLLLLLIVSLPAWAQVKITQDGNRFPVEINGKPFTTLHAGPEAFKPFFYPLLSADGIQINRSWPVEDPGGETRDHPHHRGLWFSYGDLNKVDFWTSDPLRRGWTKFPKILLKEVNDVVSGKDSGHMTQTFEWQDADGNPMLLQKLTTTFYAHPSLRIMDLDITVTALVDVTFGDTKEGAFGFRVADWMREAGGNGVITNAEGATTEKATWGKRTAWLDYSGSKDGKAVGIAMMDHPSNPRHPPFAHCRAYGMCVFNSFGDREFTGKKDIPEGSYTLEKGKSLRWVYRIVIHPGNAQQAGVGNLFQEFAARKY